MGANESYLDGGSYEGYAYRRDDPHDVGRYPYSTSDVVGFDTLSRSESVLRALSRVEETNGCRLVRSSVGGATFTPPMRQRSAPSDSLSRSHDLIRLPRSLGGPLVGSGNLSTSGAPMDSPQAFEAPILPPTSDTILIFDWDDTLMCTSDINLNRLTTMQAQRLEVVAEKVLKQAMRLGDTCIVTNADEMWVLESTRRFAPRLLPLLSLLPVLSARRKWESTFPGNVLAWKREAFREVLTGRTRINLVALGDSHAEIEAAHTATYRLQCHPLIVKTVKFKETPSCDDIIEQLYIVLRDLPALVADEKGSSRDLGHILRSPTFGISALSASNYSVGAGSTIAQRFGTAY